VVSFGSDGQLLLTVLPFRIPATWWLGLQFHFRLSLSGGCCVMSGWVGGFGGTRGSNGCISFHFGKTSFLPLEMRG
jgi:hypothetical protein